ncbi:Universal stress protein family protein [compost metagenome]
MGIRGENTAQIGSHVANVVRTLPRPILVTPSTFTAPESFMIAFDGSMRLSQGVAMLANSPLFKGLPAHLVMVGAETAEAWAMLDAAGATLSAAGHRTSLTLLPGEVVPALTAYQASQGIDVLVMGVYGHSRIRQFLHGSTTTTLLRTASAPLLLLH